jgi:hypothetical protein
MVSTYNGDNANFITTTSYTGSLPGSTYSSNGFKLYNNLLYLTYINYGGAYNSQNDPKQKTIYVYNASTGLPVKKYEFLDNSSNVFGIDILYNVMYVSFFWGWNSGTQNNYVNTYYADTGTLIKSKLFQSDNYIQDIIVNGKYLYAAYTSAKRVYLYDASGGGLLDNSFVNYSLYPALGTTFTCELMELYNNKLYLKTRYSDLLIVTLSKDGRYNTSAKVVSLSQPTTEIGWNTYTCFATTSKLYFMNNDSNASYAVWGYSSSTDTYTKTRTGSKPVTSFGQAVKTQVDKTQFNAFVSTQSGIYILKISSL